MTPFVQIAMFSIALIMLVITLIVHLFTSGKKWGSLKAVVVQHGEALDGLDSVLFKEDGTHNFVTKHEFEDHTKRCPVLICNKINDVKSLVQVNAEKLESSRFLGVRLEEGMKLFTQSLDQQREIVKHLDKSVANLKLQVAVLKQAEWDGRERRNFTGADV